MLKGFDKINRYFCFTDKDTKGFILWIVLVFCTLFLKGIIQYQPAEIPSDTASFFSCFAAISNAKSILDKTNTNKTDIYTTDNNISQIQRNNLGSTYEKDSSKNNKKVYKSPYKKKAFEVEINMADTLDFQQLWGIGSAYSKRIVEYRDRLGGFVDKKQLREVWGIDSALYSRIEPFLRLKVIVYKPIFINEISVQELKKHPYIDYYQAKEIVKYREKYGQFASVDDIQKVYLIDDETYIRIKPYISLKDRPTDKKDN